MTDGTVTRLGFDRTTSLRSRLGDIYNCYLGLCDDLTAGATIGASWNCGSESLGIACLHHACLRSQISAFTAALLRLIAVRTRNCYFTLFDLLVHRSIPALHYRPNCCPEPSVISMRFCL